MFTQLAYVWLMYEVAANVQPESSLPFLTRAPSAEGQGFSRDQWRRLNLNNQKVSREQLVFHLDRHQAASPSVFQQA